MKWGHDRGIDIEATDAEGKRLLIEAKGEARAGAQQVSYFLQALGQTIQRLDPGARHGVAFPANQQFRNLVKRLPRHAFDQLRLVVFFVRADGSVERLETPDAPLKPKS